MIHVDTNSMLNILEDQCSPAEEERVREHLARCRQCDEKFREIATIVDALSLPPLEKAPADTIQRAFAIIERDRPPRRAPVIETVAALLFDSWSQSAMTGLRGHSDSRQLSMSADELDVHLAITYDDGRVNIHGQLLVREDESFPGEFDAFLVDHSGTQFEGHTANEFGEFTFEQPSYRATNIILQLQDGRTIRCQLPRENRS